MCNFPKFSFICCKLEFVVVVKSLKPLRFVVVVKSKAKSKSGSEGLAVAAVGGGSRPAAGDTKESAPVAYPRYVLRDWFKTRASRAPCARGGLLASLVFALA